MLSVNATMVCAFSFGNSHPMGTLYDQSFADKNHFGFEVIGFGQPELVKNP